MKWFLVPALALTACGRFGFTDGGARDGSVDAVDAADALVDAAGPHDEDGDGIQDVSDPCPHIAGDDADADGDGVGDACDPFPATPDDEWVAFYPLTPGTNPLAGDPALPFTQEDDDIRFAQDFAQGFDMVVPSGVSLRLEIGFDMLSLIGTGQHVISSGVQNTGTPYYFVELNYNGAQKAANVVSYDGTNGYVNLDRADIPDYHTGRGHVRYDAVTGTAPRFSAEMGWDGELYSPAATTPGYVGNTDLRYVFGGMDVRVRYIAVIQIGG